MAVNRVLHLLAALGRFT